MTDFVKKKIVNTLIHAVQCILVHVTCYITPLKQLSMYFFFLIINNNKIYCETMPNSRSGQHVRKAGSDRDR